MKTVLVPIDFSDVSGKTAATAFSLIQDIHVNLVFLHVIPPQAPIDVFTAKGKISPRPRSNESRPAEHLLELVRQAHFQGIIATYRIARGAAIAQILEHAKQLRADLIVMGSHDSGSAHGSTVGATTKGVLYATPCPIVVVPSDRPSLTHSQTDPEELPRAS